MPQFAFRDSVAVRTQNVALLDFGFQESKRPTTVHQTTNRVVFGRWVAMVKVKRSWVIEPAALAPLTALKFVEPFVLSLSERRDPIPVLSTVAVFAIAASITSRVAGLRLMAGREFLQPQCPTAPLASSHSLVECSAGTIFAQRADRGNCQKVRDDVNQPTNDSAAVTTYVCLDSNILIRLAGRMISQSVKGCDPKDWTAFQEMVTNKDVILLVPEIVLMEVEKTVTNSGDEFYGIQQSLKNKLTDIVRTIDWSEARDDISDVLTTQIDKWRRERPAKWRNEGHRIRKWIDEHSPPIEQIRFHQMIWFQAKCRLIEGRYPKRTDEKGNPKAREWLQDNDCAIIESLSDFFGKNVADKRLLLCTENLKDFGFLRESTKRNILDKRLQPGLPPCEIFLNLASLVKALKEQMPVEPPQTEEEFEEVLKEEAEEGSGSGYGTSFSSSEQRPNVPTPGQLCGQGLQRIYNDFARDFYEARTQRNENVAAAIFRGITPLLRDFIEQEAKFVAPDKRFESLLHLREDFKMFVGIMSSLESDAFWNEGERLLASLLALARAFQLAY